MTTHMPQLRRVGCSCVITWESEATFGSCLWVLGFCSDMRASDESLYQKEALFEDKSTLLVYLRPSLYRHPVPDQPRTLKPYRGFMPNIWHGSGPMSVDVTDVSHG